MTTLIKNIQIIDGSGSASFKGDIFIRNKMIAAIGDLGRQSADTTIQGAGLYASPGFIDCATNSDHYLTLFSNPAQQDFLFQGVTTTLAGTCGSSLAPLLYGGLESIRKWGNISQVNVDWHTVKEFLDVLEKRKLGVNFGTLAGHSTIRRALIGEALRDLTEGELQIYEKILLNSLKEGAFGFSTGLSYVHSYGTPYYEIKRLVRLMKKGGYVYATELRDDRAGLVASVEASIRVSKETGVMSCITHMHPLKGYEPEYEKALGLLEENPEADVYFTLFPFETSYVPIYSFLPKWARTGNLDVMSQNLESKSLREKILNDLRAVHLGEVRIASAQGYEYLTSKLLSEFSAKREAGLAEGLLLLMKITRLRATLFYPNLDYQLIIKAMSHPRALLGSSFASFPPGVTAAERKETFPKFLSLIQAEKLMPLESGIKKITSMPAEKFGIKSRGLLKTGFYADIVLFSSEPVSGVNIQYVLINGELAIDKKELKNSVSGMILRRG